MARRGRTARRTLSLLPSLIEERPPEARIINATVMRTEWNDPADDNPNRRTAKTVRGYRAYCPLRRCIARHGDRAGYTPEHIEAADRLRMLLDGARIGFSGLRDGRPVTDLRLHYPPTGPTRPALRQLKCHEQFNHAWALFDDATRALLAAVVLMNIPLTRVAEAIGQSANLAKQRLIAALDRLVAWFDIEPVRGAA